MLLAVAVLLLAGCRGVDVRETLAEYEFRIANLETAMGQLTAYQTLLSKLDAGKTVVGYTDNGEGVCTLTFSDKSTIDLSVAGEGGGTPGIAPIFKIENDEWYVSYNNGATWTDLGSAVDRSLISDISVDEAAGILRITLADGTQIPVIYGENSGIQGHLVSIQEFGVLPTNTPEANKEALQAAINVATKQGLALYVTPVENGYPMAGGIDLKHNVALIGAHGPTGRGTVNAAGNGPTGSVFVITDREHPFIATRSATRIEGIQFYYPEQAYKNADNVIQYPPTITLPPEGGAQGVTLRDLTFYGEWFAMDFRSNSACEQILFENCYGYPLSGQFIAIDRCYDIPRILHCHVNPANMREFGRGFPPSIIDYAVNQGTYTYWIDHTDNAVLMDVFTFGAHGGIWLGENTYGQLTNFNFDCVKEGIHRAGNTNKNRTWQIAQGSIIANAGKDVSVVHPIVITGTGGHTSLTNVECFSGNNGALTNVGQSQDFIVLDGRGNYTVALTACRMSGYKADDPITVNNFFAALRATDCVDKNNQFFNRVIDPMDDFPSGTVTVLDNCDSAYGWTTRMGDKKVTLKTSGQQEGSGCLSVTGNSGVELFTKVFSTPVAACVSVERGHLQFKLYVPDITAFDTEAEGAVEITSSGRYDQQEFGWYVKDMGLKQGWNQVDLKLSAAGVTGGNPNLGAINYFRLYSWGIKSTTTLLLDDIRFYQE